MEIQLTIQQLEVIVKNARLLKTDESLSDTIVIKTLDNYKKTKYRLIVEKGNFKTYFSINHS